MDHGILNIPLAKRGNIDAQLDAFKAKQATEKKAAAKAAAQTTAELRIRAKAIVAAMTAERIAELAEKTNSTPGKVRHFMQSAAHWKPEWVIKAEGGAA